MGENKIKKIKIKKKKKNGSTLAYYCENKRFKKMFEGKL